MKCQQCGIEPAKVQYTEVIAGHKAMEWLCVACATERGLVLIHAEQDPELPSSPAPLRPEALQLSCPSCSTTLAAVRRSGRLGCAQCYQVFWEHLEPLIRRVHGTSSHSHDDTTFDAQSRLQRILDGLRRELHDAVRREEFERAAALRDEIERHEVELAAERGTEC